MNHLDKNKDSIIKVEVSKKEERKVEKQFILKCYSAGLIKKWKRKCKW